MKKWFLVLMVGLALVLAACGQDNDKSSESKKETKKEQSSDANITYPQLTKEVTGNEKLVEMKTSMGTIKIKLFPDQAPKAVENFVTHSEKGYYDGLKFHRVINDFMIQGGDPEGTGMGGESIWGKPFEDEFSPELFNLRGALSMANSGPDTNGSQFFIVQNKAVDPDVEEQMKSAGFPKEVIESYMKNGGTPWLDQKHTVFGQVIEGMDVVDDIAAVEVGDQDAPKKDVIIESIKVVK
ncbi:putative peptidyl-prolyl cis-trans isomerase [Bacillus sp. 349Y]|uniref:peptidylprolyl isomerase n=1 Tax=Rossellomorea marisflavi TaxID=189381 RepID=UPI0012EF2FC6|nr:peptidylprolyl isomerase [Rossellomorea marisflavi]MCM2591384.1 peptidylprolyl isomerase [Rossellomorea marisflavi]VXC03312.1 putative peptidyl-prolyl cis-trans isomerase [Bacillus sp. 349Y]